MVRDKFHIPAFPLLRSTLALTALVAVVAGVSVMVLNVVDRMDMVWAALATGAVCLVASLVALTPIWLVSNAHADALPGACLVSMLVRLTLTLGGAVLLSDVGFDRPVMAGWTIGWYVLLLAVEAIVLVRFMSGIGPRREATSEEISPC
jgi:hypothetical protein